MDSIMGILVGIILGYALSHLFILLNINYIYVMEILCKEINNLVIFTAELFLNISLTMLFIIITVFLFCFIGWLSKNEGTVVIPFEVSEGTRNYDGKTISYMFFNEIKRIDSNFKKFAEGEDFLTTKDLYKKLYDHFDLEDPAIKVPELVTKSENVETAFSELEITIQSGLVSIPFTNAIILLKRLWPIGEKRSLISGRINEIDQTICLVIILERNKKVDIFEASYNFDNYPSEGQYIKQLVIEVSQKLIYKLSRESGLLANMGSLSDFSNYSNALNNFYLYAETADIAYIKKTINYLLLINTFKSYNIYILAYELGLLLIERNDLKNACQVLELALKIRPNDIPTLIWLGYSLRTIEDFEGSIKKLTRAVEASKNESYFALSQLGITYYYNKNYKLARESFEKALEIKVDGSLYYNLAITYEKEGDLQASLKSLKDALANTNNQKKRQRIADKIKQIETSVSNSIT